MLLGGGCRGDAACALCQQLPSMAESVPSPLQTLSSSSSHHEWPSQDPSPQYHTVARTSLLVWFPSPSPHCTVLPGAGATTSNCRAVLQKCPIAPRSAHDLHVWQGHIWESLWNSTHNIPVMAWKENDLSHPPALFMTIYLVSSIGQGIKRYVFPPAFNLGIQYDIIFMGFSRITSSPCTTYIWVRKKLIEALVNGK